MAISIDTGETAHLVDLRQARLELANLIRELRIDRSKPVEPVRPSANDRRKQCENALDRMSISLSAHRAPLLRELIELSRRKSTLQRVANESRGVVCRWRIVVC